MGNIKRGLADKDENAVKKQKVITLEVKLESTQIGITDEIADHGSVDLPAFQESLVKLSWLSG